MSKAVFCRAEGVSNGALDHWLRVLREERTVGGFVEASFVEAEVNQIEANAAQPHVEVELPFGVKLKFFGVQR